MKPLHIFILNKAALEQAKKLQHFYPQACILIPRKIENHEGLYYDDFKQALQNSFREGASIAAFCASGILIRILAPLLHDKFNEPAVLSIAEDGTSIVPLLGANAGANKLASYIADCLGGHAAITTSAEIRFSINLLNPPDDLQLINPQHAKSFIADMLNGTAISLKGKHPWLEQVKLPIKSGATHLIEITEEKKEGSDKHLVYLKKHKNKGKITVVGLGPGALQYRTPAASKAIQNADIIMGYDFYIRLAAPYMPHQKIIESDNRMELARAKEAHVLASKGYKVALLSSGDPGIFGMSAALMEAWESIGSDDIQVQIEPGVSAAMMTSARVGALLGHDFAVISLSDNLKPWSIIEKRIKAAIESDLVIAFYNPVSKARPNQIIRCIELLREHCHNERYCIIGSDIGREQEATKIVTLSELNSSDINSRSTLLVGSSQTRVFIKNGMEYAYTPRHYPK